MDCNINRPFWGIFFPLWACASVEVLNYLWDTLCFWRMVSLGMNSKAGGMAGFCVQILGYQGRLSKLVTIFLTGRWGELSHSSDFLAAILEQGWLKSPSELPNLSGASLCKKPIATSGMDYRGIESVEEKKMAFSVWFTCCFGELSEPLAGHSDVTGRLLLCPKILKIFLRNA